MKITKLGLIPMTLSALGLIACSSESSEPKAPVNIAWIAKGTENTFFEISRVGAKLAADDLTAASGRDVNVELMDPVTVPDATQLAADQVTKIEEAIEAKVDAINVSVLNPELATPAINAAVEAGIPVLTFDSDAPDSDRATYYGIDNYEGAELLANTLATLINKKGKVAIMSVTSTSKTYMDRMDAFKATMEKYPDIELVADPEGKGFFECGKTQETEKVGCTGVLEDAMAANPDIDAWYLARGRVLREADLATKAPTWTSAVESGMKVVAFDAPEDALPAIQDGYTDMVLGQKMFGWGYDLVSLSFDIVTAGRKVESFTDSTYDVICKNNIDELVDMWKAKDFRSEMAKCDLL